MHLHQLSHGDVNRILLIISHCQEIVFPLIFVNSMLTKTSIVPILNDDGSGSILVVAAVIFLAAELGKFLQTRHAIHRLGSEKNRLDRKRSWPDSPGTIITSNI